ncbi:uncharacterized protein LOC124888999 [Capsicum annuum]|uniref:uncharacterized protein LOC124888999 n=1 Tax=Capsicum annuum TaxID=4072 RepID=UPI001FB0B0CB|nr:uncharacterized protein LOC124888999 [Capsicum annuum]
MLKSQELWDLVERGYVEPNPVPAQPSDQLWETREKDAKALFLIQSALDNEISPRIATATTSNQAWETLKQEYLGDKKVITVKLQTLRLEFKILAMKDKESMQEYMSRVSGVVNHMKTYGENVNNETVMSKVLRSLTKIFDHVVAAIEESKDLSTYTFDKLMSSLLAHEVWISRSYEKVEEKTFQAKRESFHKGKSEYSGGRGRGNNIMYKYCKKLGHIEVDCWTKQRDDQKQANFTEEVEEGSKLFMTQYSTDDGPDGVWFMDSG